MIDGSLQLLHLSANIEPFHLQFKFYEVKDKCFRFRFLENFLLRKVFRLIFSIWMFSENFCCIISFHLCKFIFRNKSE